MPMLLISTTADANGDASVRYAQLGSGRKVTSAGEVRLADLPAGEARLAFYTRTAFFGQIETEKSSARMLPIQARRQIDSELAFNEPFRARQRASSAGEGRQNLSMAAVAEADYGLVAGKLPLAQRPFACITAAECALAALVGKVTAEPVRLLWRRGSHMLGLLVEHGDIHARHATRVEREAALDEATFSNRVLPLLAAAANRANAGGVGRDLVITLTLGDWSTPPEDADSKIAAGVGNQLQALFPGAPAGDVLAWPEMYGLAFVGSDFNFLTADYQAEVDGVRFTKPVLWGAGAVALLMGTVAAFAFIQSNRLGSDLEARRVAINTNVQAVQAKLPTPADIEALKRRMGVQNALEGIRLDRFLAWVSANTPKGMIIRKLDVTREAAAAATAPPSTTAGAMPPAQSWKAVIEYEVPGLYAEVEKKSATVIAALGTKVKLVSNQLTVKNDEPSRLSITLVTQETGFTE